LCPWKEGDNIGAKPRYRAPPTLTQEQRNAGARKADWLKGYVAKIGAGKRRSIYLKGENPVDVEKARQAAHSDGFDDMLFEWMRLIENGWTLNDEIRFAKHARRIGLSIYQGNTRLNELPKDDFEALSATVKKRRELRRATP
jgi:hypothetical protein